MKRMLFNATHPEELRVSIVDGQKLIDIDIESSSRQQRKSNIYKGIVTRVEPSLEACFVDYGEERHGFLPFKEISRSYFNPDVDFKTATIKEAITEGTELIVQVEKEERGNKGAALTTFISLAGRYLVLMPNNPRGGGVSRRIEGEERQELRATMAKLETPRGMSLIARTAGIGRSVEELQWDLDYLLKLWTAISEAATPQYEDKSGNYVTEPTDAAGRPLKRVNPAPFLIVEESNLVIRAIRDYFQPEISEILVDTDDIYEQARQFMGHVMPDMVNRVKRYTDDIPLFSRFQIENQIETAYSRTVPLPSGGAIVIDHTEALVAIDVNSAKATKGVDIEETAFRTNIEAADEVARQMRLRDLGGLIVIDFIDMLEPKNQKAIEVRMKDAIHYDRARVQIARISKFGLMELSRQRLRPSLYEGSHIACPRCNGVGVIRDTESSAIQILRILQEEALKGGTYGLQAQVPVDVATFLLNEKRAEIAQIEARHNIEVILIPNKTLETPHYLIERLKNEEERLDDGTPSYRRVEELDVVDDEPYSRAQAPQHSDHPKQIPVIKGLPPREDAPQHVESVKTKKTKEAAKKSSESKGLWSKIVAFFTGSSEEQKPAKKSRKDRKENQRGAKKDASEKRNRRQERNDKQEKAPKKREQTPRAERRARNDEDRKSQSRESRAQKVIAPQFRAAEPVIEENVAPVFQAPGAEETLEKATTAKRTYPIQEKRQSYPIQEKDNSAETPVQEQANAAEAPAEQQAQDEAQNVRVKTSQEAVASGTEERKRQRRTLKRDRYGRTDKPSRAERAAKAEAAEAAEAAPAVESAPVETSSEAPVREETHKPRGRRRSERPAQEATQEASVNEAPVQAAEAKAEAPKAAVEHREEKPVDLQPILKEAGLELISTKAQPAQPVVEAPKPKLGRKRIKKPIVEEDVHLELVQTKKE